MFVRKLHIKSNGKTYVQVVEKSYGKYKVLKSFGGSVVDSEIEFLVGLGRSWINEQQGSVELDFDDHRRQVERYLDGAESLRLVGLELTLGKIFDEIGFNRIADPIFRNLVLYRLVYPRSKLKTTEYLQRYADLNWDVDQVYRYMDKLHLSQKQEVEQISYNHSVSVLGGNISVVFYDVTTVYFEIEQEDELRKPGFSKDGKHQHPQIVLGLLTGPQGYPLAYDIFEGNKFEGSTMLPVIESFRSRFNIASLVIVADSGLLSKINLDTLESNGHQYVLGARIKNENKDVKEKILALKLANGECATIEKGHQRLIVSYSDKRARKDAYNREKGMRKLQKLLQSGRLTKGHLNKRGYNKFLKMDGNIQVAIDEQKCIEDARWDGIKGYLTNTTLSTDEVMENYGHLWQIEKAFRIAKSDLKIRPVYHRLQRRIQAHICLTFVAYKVYKELERKLIEMKAEFSPGKVIEIAQGIFEIKVKIPNTRESLRKVLILSEEQKTLAALFGFGC